MVEKITKVSTASDFTVTVGMTGVRGYTMYVGNASDIIRQWNERFSMSVRRWEWFYSFVEKNDLWYDRAVYSHDGDKWIDFVTYIRLCEWLAPKMGVEAMDAVEGRDAKAFGVIRMLNDYGEWCRKNGIPVTGDCDRRRTYIFSDGGDLYKIGYTADLERRFKEVYSDNISIRIAKVVDGDVAKKLKERFSDRRVDGSWYKLTKEDIDSIV